ncbi:MAG TPA: hypothetical protein VN661_06290 [Candidatus Acidoferrales bacterium]|nr:hypothetical protein [Candidatus Acidoferrales bacterium]
MTNAKPRREAAILVLVVFILGVLLGAFGSHIWGQRIWGAPIEKVAAPHPMATLTKELKLTPDQRKKFDAIIDDTQSQFHALHDSPGAAALRVQRDQIRKHWHDGIRAILKPEQQATFDQFMQKLNDRGRRPAAH